jgi:hypothetical protein
MIEIQNDMWVMIGKNNPDAVCITTCQVTNSRGHLIMGAGIAKQAKEKHPELPSLWGRAISKGNKDDVLITRNIAPYVLLAFPTKKHWKDPSIPRLIKQSAETLLVVTDLLQWECVFLPRPGCSNGGLEWKNVRPILEDVGLDDRFFIFNF